MLYFPSGAWHKVVTEEDSISINISLMSSTWADLLSDALKTALWRNDTFRRPINVRSFEHMRTQAEIVLAKAKHELSLLTPAILTPPSLLLPLVLELDVESLNESVIVWMDKYFKPKNTT
eukprot:Filipodium_phascolosomae@DN7997_c0_g1_i1.p1